MTKLFLAITLLINLLAPVSNAQVINIKDTSLTYADLFLSGDQFKTLEPVDQVTYLMALSFLTYTNQILHAPNLVSQNECLPVEIQNSKSKWSLLFQATVPQAHALLSLVRLALTPAVRSQLGRVAGIVYKGTQSVNKIVTSRLATNNLKLLGEKVKTEQALIFNLTAKRVSLAKNSVKNSKALTDVDAKLMANKASLRRIKAEFKQHGGTNHQMFKIVEEAKKSRWTKLNSFALTGLGFYGGFELLDNLFFSKPNENQSKINPDSIATIHQSTIAEGEPCLYGLHPSIYEYTPRPFLKCALPSGTVDKSICPRKDEFQCPSFGFSLILPNAQTKPVEYSQLFCIKHLPLESLGARCMEKIVTTMKQLTLKSETTNLPADLQWDSDKAIAYVNEMHAARYRFTAHDYFATTQKRPGIKIRDYCAASAVKENPTQQGECSAIETFLSAVESTKISEIFFSAQTLADKTTEQDLKHVK